MVTKERGLRKCNTHKSRQERVIELLNVFESIDARIRSGRGIKNKYCYDL